MSEDIANVDVPEIEVTPEMIEALEGAFLDWYGYNFNILDDGGAGDVYGLFLTLNAAAWNASISRGSNTIAVCKSTEALENFST